MEVDISGAKVFFTTPIDVPLLGELQISETLIVSWIVMALITGICFWLTRGLKVRNISKNRRQPNGSWRLRISLYWEIWEKSSGT